MTVCSAPLAPNHEFSVVGNKQLLTLELPSLESLKGVDLDIGSKEIRLLLPGSCEHLEITLPPGLVGTLSIPVAKFSSKRRQLTVTWDLPTSPPGEVLPAERDTTTQMQAGDTAAVVAPQKCAASEGTSSSNEITNVAEQKCAPAKAVDCLEEVEYEIEHALKQCTVSKLKSIASINGSSVLLSDFSVKGVANMEGGCCSFKVTIHFTWEVMDAFGGFLGATGTGEVSQFTQEQSLAVVTMKSSGRGSLPARTAGDWMKQQGARIVGECLNGHEISSVVASEWEEPETEAPTVPLTQWAEEWLQQKLSNLTVKLFGGSACANFVKPQISGDVSSSVQDGKPIPIFKLRVECAWNIVTATGQTEGTLLVPDFTPGQRGEGIAVDVEAAPGKKASGQLLTAFKQMGVSAVRSLLDRFSNELQLRIKS